MAKIITVITVPLVVTIESDAPLDIWETMKLCHKHISIDHHDFADVPGRTLVGLWAEWEHPQARTEEANP